MRAIVRTAVESAGGTLVKTEGDGCFAAFRSAGAAVRAAAIGQDELGPLRVRGRSDDASTHGIARRPRRAAA